jgi:hypothetical protein
MKDKHSKMFEKGKK